MKDSFLYGSFQTAGLCVLMVSGFQEGVEIDQKGSQGTGSLASLSVLVTIFSAVG